MLTEILPRLKKAAVLQNCKTAAFRNISKKKALEFFDFLRPFNFLAKDVTWRYTNNPRTSFYSRRWAACLRTA